MKSPGLTDCAVGSDPAAFPRVTAVGGESSRHPRPPAPKRRIELDDISQKCPAQASEAPHARLVARRLQLNETFNSRVAAATERTFPDNVVRDGAGSGDGIPLRRPSPGRRPRPRVTAMLPPEEYADIVVTVAHPWGDVEVPLNPWIRTGPGPRPHVSIIAASAAVYWCRGSPDRDPAGVSQQPRGPQPPAARLAAMSMGASSQYRAIALDDPRSGSSSARPTKKAGVDSKTAHGDQLARQATLGAALAGVRRNCNLDLHASPPRRPDLPSEPQFRRWCHRKSQLDRTAGVAAHRQKTTSDALRYARAGS